MGFFTNESFADVSALFLSRAQKRFDASKWHTAFYAPLKLPAQQTTVSKFTAIMAIVPAYDPANKPVLAYRDVKAPSKFLKPVDVVPITPAIIVEPTIITPVVTDIVLPKRIFATFATFAAKPMQNIRVKAIVVPANIFKAVAEPAAPEPKRTTLKLKTSVELPVVTAEPSRASAKTDLAALFKAELRQITAEVGVAPVPREEVKVIRKKNSKAQKSLKELAEEAMARAEKETKPRQLAFDLADAFKREMQALAAEQSIETKAPAKKPATPAKRLAA